MPGAYAHITLVNHVQKQAESAQLSDAACTALGLHLKYAELGAVSPDYPYRAIGSGEGHWADKMHYTTTSSMVRNGVQEVSKLTGIEREKATSWLFGYVAHMAADMTIHPVVERLVGTYADNKTAHRRCEMHQDAYIFERMEVGEAGVSEHLKSGIASCTAEEDDDALDTTIVAVWTAMLTSAYAHDAAQASPRPALWHSGFTGVLRTVSSVTRLFLFARHVAVGCNLTYPRPKAVRKQYIEKLATPRGIRHYDAIFDLACANVLEVWKGLDRALHSGDRSYIDAMHDWDLDTGKSNQTDRLVFWRAA